jgi:quercetin dioxygenase-like cupin family protein
LRLGEYTLATGAPALSLPPAPRVLYVIRGDAVARAGGADVRLDAGVAWHTAASCAVRGAAAGATLLCWEVVRAGAAGGRALLEHALDLDAGRDWLMRCDRVDFDPGGVALPHGHRGGGIRYLLAGALEVMVGDGAPRRMTPGSAWFESGREPVLARAAPDAVTSFVRCAILPREIRGASSIVYVDPDDAARGRPRTYTVWVDEPIELP